MPMKPKRPCRMTLCNGYAVEGDCYCKKHKQQIEKHYNKFQRGYDESKRYGSTWTKIRKHYIEEHPLCELCWSKGKAKTAVLVHHKKPLSVGGTHAAENLMALCSSCHEKIHAELGDRKGKG